MTERAELIISSVKNIIRYLLTYCGANIISCRLNWQGDFNDIYHGWVSQTEYAINILYIHIHKHWMPLCQDNCMKIRKSNYSRLRLMLLNKSAAIYVRHWIGDNVVMKSQIDHDLTIRMPPASPTKPWWRLIWLNSGDWDGNAVSQNILPFNANITRHTAHTVVSWPNPIQWLNIHISDLMMTMRIR